MNGATSRAVLLGHPLIHSISPAIHNAAFKHLGLDASYSLCDIGNADLQSSISNLRTPGYLGANVTVPYKIDAIDYLNTLSDDALIIGAINTIVPTGQVLHGENTDAYGIDRALTETLGLAPYGTRILLLGAGGAGRAAAVALIRGGPARLSIYNRSPSRAIELVQELRQNFGDRIYAVNAEQARDEGSDCDLIMNATSAGLDATSLPLGNIIPRPGCAYFDMIYNPAITPMMQAMSEQGVAVAGGLSMLVHQAARSFELWTGQPAPVDIMRDAAQHAMRG